MTVPLRYFLVGFAFLLAGGAVGLARVLGGAPGFAELAHVHLLLVGWVCLTIMGATTQFAPVWSNVPLHSRRLANATLVFVVVGVGVLPESGALAGGALLVAGFVVFAANILGVVWRHGCVLPERFAGRPENAD
jgi:cbb3-type cytochrome oxidase subunit 1